MKLGQTVRLLLLVLAVAAGGVAVLLLAAPWLPHPLADLPPVGPTAERGAVPGFAGLVTSTCAVAALACWTWLVAGTVVVALETLLATAPRPARRRPWVPAAVRVLVPVLVGAAVGAAPAGATDTRPSVGAARAGAVGAAGNARTGLPLPDRALTGPAVHDTVRVRPGDTLWGIAVRLLPAGTGPAGVDRGWRRLARANADQVSHPDLIHPGTRLRVPPLTAHPREEDR